MLKSAFEKAELIKLTYGDHKDLLFDRFHVDLENPLKNCPNSYNSFEQFCSPKPNECSPIKAKWVTGTNESHIKNFIMKSSKLKK